MNTPDLVNSIIASSTIIKIQAGIIIRSMKSTLTDTFTLVENTNLYNYNYFSTMVRISEIKYYHNPTKDIKQFSKLLPRKYKTLTHLPLNKLY